MRHSLSALALLFSVLLGARSSPAPTEAQGLFMGTEELRRGMRGMGKTVFQGTAIDTFQVEILGVTRNFLGPRQDLILARLSGGPIGESGVIAGMSGSPVYVEGRLIGAVAYSFAPFPKSPICGITPIRDMLRTLERGLEPPLETQHLGSPFEMDPQTAAQLREGVEGLPVPLTLEPLGTPVWAAGFTPAASQALAELLRPMGLSLLAAPGGQAPPDSQISFIPGAALGVQLISGDMSATGIGTLTYVDGARIVGFGHPMMLAGATDLPMTGAYIYEVIPSQLRSIKLGAATRPVGAIRQDRSPAIAGLIGAIPQMLPVEVEIRAQDGAQQFHFEILPHRDLSPGLAQVVLLAALESAEKLFGDATLQVRATLQLRDGRVLHQEQIYSGPTAIFAAAQEAVLPLSALSQTQFTGLELAGLRFELELTECIATAQVLGLRVAQPILKSGEAFVARVTLQPFHRQPVEQQVEIALPAELPPGPLVLRVGSGAASQAWESQRRPDALQPRDAQQLLALLGQQERDDDLVVELYRPESSLTLEGRELPGLPPSARAVLDQERSAGRVGPVYGRVLLRQRVRTGYVLSGEQTLELMVRRP